MFMFLQKWMHKLIMVLHLKVNFNSLGYMETGQRLSLMIQQTGEADE